MIGIAAGAVVPESTVVAVVAAISRRTGGAVDVAALEGPEERVAFELPKQLRT